MWAWIRDKTEEMLHRVGDKDLGIKQDLKKVNEIAKDQASRDSNRHKKNKEAKK